MPDAICSTVTVAGEPIRTVTVDPCGSVAAFGSLVATATPPPAAPTVLPMTAPFLPPKIAPSTAPPTAAPPIFAALSRAGDSPSR